MTDQTMSEAEIAQAATVHMGAPGWYTVGLTLGSIGLYALLFIFATNGPIQLAIAFVASCYLVYAIYTPLHEAVHKNISGKSTELQWVNHAIGYLSAALLGVSYTMHKSAHLTHHRNTNVEGDDPDFVTRGGSLGDVLSCGLKMVLSEYQDYFSRVFPKAPRAEQATVIAEIVLFLGWRIALCLAGFTLEVVVLAVFANVVGVTLLGYIFAWIVHTPYNETERYRTTATIFLPPAIHKLGTRLWLWQNYHSVHHLFPRVPFYNYQRLFEQIEPGMVERGAPMRYVGNQRDQVAA